MGRNFSCKLIKVVMRYVLSVIDKGRVCVLESNHRDQRVYSLPASTKTSFSFTVHDYRCRFVLLYCRLSRFKDPFNNHVSPSHMPIILSFLTQYATSFQESCYIDPSCISLLDPKIVSNSDFRYSYVIT